MRSKDEMKIDYGFEIEGARKMAFPKTKVTTANFTTALTFSISIALSILTALAPVDGHARSKKAQTRNSRQPRIEFLKASEIKRLSPQQKFEYLSSLQKAMAHFDKKTRFSPVPKAGAKKKAMLWWLMPNALAQNAGDSCWPGGYYSELSVQANGQLICTPPADSSLWDAPAGGFFCGPEGSRESKAYCNSALYLTGRDSKQFCVPYANQTENCRDEFLREFGQSNGQDGDPNYPARLSQAYNRLTATLQDTTSLDAFFAETAAHVEYALASGDPRAEEFRRLRDQISYMKRAKEVAATMPATTTEPSTADAPPAANTNSNPLAPEKSLRPQARPSRPSATDDTANPSPNPASAQSVLGKELTCVQDGLKSLGHQPSERYIALLGTAVQAFNGTYNLNDEASRQAYQARVISMVRSFGYCDQSSYPPVGEESDITLIRRWMTADNGRIRSERRLGYIAQGVERGTTAELAALRLCQTFGFGGKNRTCERTGITETANLPFETLFRIQEDAFDRQPLEERQAVLTSYKPSSGRNKSIFDECHANLIQRAKSDPAFKVSALTQVNGDGIARDEARQAAAKNREVCEAMAKSCQLDLTVACQAPGAVGSSATPAPAATPSRGSSGSNSVK